MVLAANSTPYSGIGTCCISLTGNHRVSVVDPYVLRYGVRRPVGCVSCVGFDALQSITSSISCLVSDQQSPARNGLLSKLEMFILLYNVHWFVDFSCQNLYVYYSSSVD